MGVTAPAWLVPAFVRACRGAGGSADTQHIEAVGEGLVERWEDPRRTFHGVRHLAHVLAHVDELAEETHDPDLVRLAAFYHGAVFDTSAEVAYAGRAGEDAQAGARLAQEELTYLGLPEDAVGRVAELVTAVGRHTAEPDDVDAAVLCDADLAVLAVEPQRYKRYLEEVRAEYAHIPDEAFVRARVQILRRLVARPQLFLSPLGAAWEDRARQNVEAELHRRTKELARLEAEAAGEPR